MPSVSFYKFVSRSHSLLSPTAQGGGLTVRIRRVSLANPMILECYVEGGGSGSYTYEWRKDSRFLSRGPRLTVDKLEASTAGGYECIVSGIGPRGQVRGDFTYNMRVLVKQTETKICE